MALDCGNKYVVGVYLGISLVQLALSVALLVYGTEGLTLLQHEETGSGVPYPVGALLVGTVFAITSISSTAMVILWLLNVDAVSYVACCFCVFLYISIPAFILGLIFTIAFGLANCKTEGKAYDQQAGFCSYQQNIDENYEVATISLVLISLLFVTAIADVFILCKYGDLQNAANDTPTVSPTENSGTYNINTQSSTTYHKNTPSLYDHNTSSSGGYKNPTLRKMAQDRIRRNDEQRQRRMGVPENRITRKFIGKFGF